MSARFELLWREAHPRRAFPVRFAPHLKQRAQAYKDKVLALSPVCYWPLWEPSGSTAYDISGNNCHAAYSGVTLGAPGTGDGNTSIYINGSTGYVNLYSSLFNSLLNRSAGTFALWAKVASSSFWSDGQDHCFWMVYSNVSNQYFMCQKYGTGYGPDYRYKPSTTSSYAQVTSTTEWMHLALSWNIAASRWRAYFNGIKVFDDGGTVSAFGSGLDTGRCLIGASAANLKCFLGYLAHAALFASELTPEQVQNLAQL